MEATPTEVDDYDHQEEDDRDDSKYLHPSRSILVVRYWIDHMPVRSLEVARWFHRDEVTENNPDYGFGTSRTATSRTSAGGVRSHCGPCVHSYSITTSDIPARHAEIETVHLHPCPVGGEWARYNIRHQGDGDHRPANPSRNQRSKNPGACPVYAVECL